MIFTRSATGLELPQSRINSWSIDPSDFVGIEMHHTVTRAGHNVDDVKDVVKGVQAYHMYAPSRKYPDIFYNYLVDQKGNIYEGRGWRHSSKQNFKWFTLNLIGYYHYDENARIYGGPHQVTDAQIEVIRQFRRELVNRGGGQGFRYHSDRGGTVCPGNIAQPTLERAHADGRLAIFPKVEEVNDLTPEEYTALRNDIGNTREWLKPKLTKLQADVDALKAKPAATVDVDLDALAEEVANRVFAKALAALTVE